MRKKKLMNLLVLTVHVCIHHFALSGELWQVWSTMCCGSEECLQRAWSSGIALIIATAWSRVTTYSRGLLNLFYLNWICCCIKQFCNITNLMKLYFFFLIWSAGHIFGVRIKSIQAPGFDHWRRGRPCDSGDSEDLLEEDLQEEEVDTSFLLLYTA